MIKKVFDELGKPKTLGAPPIADGGEGTVYCLKDKPETIVKIFHPEKLSARGSPYQKKIEAMISIKSKFEKSNVCWPLLSVFDSSGKWIGYAMKQGLGSPMRYLAHGVVYKKHFPNLDRVVLLQFLLSFLTNIEELHSKNVFIGDYNMRNFLCNKDNNKVTMIDCDSYQLTINDIFFPCPVGAPDFTPTEHHNKDFKKIKRTLESEQFSLAIVLFECLMLGRHPYDIVGGDDPVTNLCNANFPYGIGKNGKQKIPKGPWYNIWSHMPFRIKDLFIQTFTEGVYDVNKRVDVLTWKKEISTYLYLLRINRDLHREIIPEQPKDHIYRGTKVLEKIGGR